jgi:hypothetical protein
MVVAVRNNTTIKEFSEIQDRCFALNLTLIPILNVSELPQLLVQMVCNIFILYFRSCVMEINMQIYHSFLIIKPTRCTNFSNLFLKWTLLVSDSSSVHHQEFFTVHTAMVCVTQVCRPLASRIRMEHPDPACKLSANLYDTYHCCVHRCVDSLQAGSGCSILILLASCQQTCMTHTIAVCTAKNSRWWTG